MTYNLSFADGIPPAGPNMDIIRLKANESLQVVVLAEDIRAIFVHWNAATGRKGRSEPCQKEACSGCARRLPRKWLGYIHVWLPKKKREAFMELTSGGSEDLRNMLPPAQTLRGTSAVIQRMNGDKARLRVEIFPSPKDYDTSVFPAEKLPWETLSILWNMARDDRNFEM